MWDFKEIKEAWKFILNWFQTGGLQDPTHSTDGQNAFETQEKSIFLLHNSVLEGGNKKALVIKRVAFE